ncbi:MAG: PTS sugar transporter subunit IIA [Deltaproteobacteria bacterium HGW-Deltaproteobacteria-21]|nr:MAG: PTS sugar transporter subunit IIA [Deltaproteobacteria bacterium HGW-Deltaproteobacteria-21]
MKVNRADSFLHMIRRSRRGKLKIYLGYCAGVGKTYQMLLEARRLREENIDVVAGFVETHGREETEPLLNSLEWIPRRRIVYRGIEIEEMDLDAILARRPSVVLVDDLAHTNVPGSRNPRRYQDVEELLSAGIHVISSVNIQHLESLYETVERATGVRVRERIPDRIVSEADQIVSVDITTEDLRQRLQEGKVYVKESIETALTGFFRSTNLEQLRELTLRELAAQIDSRRRDPLEEEGSTNPDQVMVCLSSRGPNSEALLRYGSRLAGRLNRNWYAVYVQTSSERPTVIDAETQRILSNTLTLAQQLGATVFTYRGEDVVKTILQFAKEYRVGHIVIGTPAKKPPLMKRLLGQGGVAERMIAESRSVTIVVLDTRAIGEVHGPAPITVPKSEMELSNKAEKAAPSLEGTHPGHIPILMWDEPIDKESAIRHLMNACCRANSNICETAWAALIDRERQGGTFLGEDVAVPHARVRGIERPIVGLGVGRSGIYDPEAGRSFRIMIFLLSPVSSPDSHVAMLGAISRTANDDQWRKEVLAASNPADIAHFLREWESQVVA